MGFFKNIFKSDKGKNEEKKDFSYISEIAALITNNDLEVMKNINSCIENLEEYIKVNSDRYNQRGNLKNCNIDKLCWLALNDELGALDYLLSVDCNDDLEQFLWTLESIKTYCLIDIDISSLNFNENENVESWGKEINNALNGKAYVCMVDIDSDSYELIIISAEIYKKISKIAENNGHSIKAF